MASNLYLKIDGIAGESKAASHPDTIEILNFSYSCYQPVSEARSGTIHTSGRCNHGTFNCSKYTDIASTDLLMAMWSGKTIASAVMSAVTNNGDALVEYLTITLTNVVIANFSLHCGGNSIAGEELSISFSGIKVEYHNQGEDGQQPGTKASEWDLSTEQKK